MKIKNKITSILFIFLVIVFIVVSAFYMQVTTYFHELNQKNITHSYEEISQRTADSYEGLKKILKNKEELFKNIHIFAQDKIRAKGAGIDIFKLKESIAAQFKEKESEISIIGNDFIILKSTLSAEKGADLKKPMPKSIVQMLERRKTSADSDAKVVFHVPEIGVDEPRSRSYSYIKELGIFVELSFADRDIKEYILKNFAQEGCTNGCKICATESVSVIHYCERNGVLKNLHELKQLPGGKVQMQESEHEYFNKSIETGKPYEVMKKVKEKTYLDTYARVFEVDTADEAKWRFFTKIRVDVSDYANRMETLNVFFIATIVFSIIVFIAIFYIIKRYLLYPVRVLEESMEKMAEVHDEKVLKSKDEFAGLTRNYNEMLSQLNEYQKNLKRKIEEGIDKNIQQQKMLEFQCRLAQMGEMIGMIGHQWKQPLSHISLLVQMLEDDCVNGEINEEYIKKTSKKIIDQVIYMSGTVDDFKNFFEQKKEKTVFNLKKSVFGVLNLVGAIYKKENISIEIEGDDSIDTLGYLNEYNQVTINILNNARDELLKKDVKKRSIKVLVYRENGSAVMSIEDNAGGIPEEIIGTVFEPYFSTKGDGGTGIGLYISKMIIEKNMRGSLSVRNSEKNSEGERGAIFKITTPLYTKK